MLTLSRALQRRPQPVPRLPSSTRRAALCAAALALAGVAPLAAQGQGPALPPLGALVSTDGLEWFEEISGFQGYGYLRGTALPAAAWTWYRPVTNAVIDDPNYFAAGGLLGLAAVKVDLGDVLGDPVFEYGNEALSYIGASWEIDANAAALHDVLARMLLADGGPSDWAAITCGGLLPYATSLGWHDYHTSDYHDWELFPGSDAFNLDALRQQAVWQQVAAEVQMEQDEFFLSSRYAQTFKYVLDVNVTLIGVRSSSIVPSSTPPGNMSIAPYEADPFPFELPKVTRSGAAHIRFGGEGYEKLVFGPPDAILPIFSVTAGTTFVLTAAGFRPGMQVLLAADGLPNRYVLSPTWEGYGKIGIPIPLGIQGVHVLTHVRYQHDGPTGPFWGPWRQVPVPQPHFFVHP